jgi:SAM-dependent methyltransferase
MVGHGDGLGRSARLFRSFLTEQSDPDGFYSTIADDTVGLVRRHATLDGADLLDVGGGPGYYTRAFRAAGANCVLVDADQRELTSRGPADRGAVIGDARRLPRGADAVDIAFSSNLLEHVDDPWGVARELVRVVRPGGLLVLSYTIWLGPWGGHETSPWHYLGGDYAARRYERRTGHSPKNVYGTSLFKTSVAAGLRWARSAPGMSVVEVRPRYLPPACRRLLAVPGLRELVTWNLWLVLRKT